jgi:D-tyrosyl-tRNA(Tyr) deacylase
MSGKYNINPHSKYFEIDCIYLKTFKGIIMRAVIQRVSRASVTINEKVRAEIAAGLLVLIGIEESDNDSDAEWLSKKIVQLRIFNDNDGIMNLSVLDVGGSILAISQFTLHAKTRKGNRPSYTRAAPPSLAIPLYDSFVSKLSQLLEKEVATGEFGAMMQIELINDGPVTIIIDTKEKE